MNFNIKTSLQRIARVMMMPALFLAGGLIVTVPFSAASDVDTANVNVTATIITSACEIGLSPSGGLSFAVDSADLVTGKISDTHTVTLTLSGCGYGYASKKPTVTLSGFHPDASEVPSGADRLSLFKDAVDPLTNNAEGFWVVVATDGTPELDDLYKDGEEVLIGDENTTGDDSPPSDIYIGVSCMNSSPCGKQAGALKATLSFTFKYQ
ncbi:UNVERIFIED_ORG: hypothetical protein M2414_005142 [Rahnella aquatilis]